MSKRIRHNSVADAVGTVSPEIRQALEKRLQQREVVKSLIAKRAVQGLSQTDIAAKMKCSQSRISKLENGTDADLRLDDLFSYLEALGLDATIQVHRRNWP